ncbi:UDP-glycosyltransferase 91C1-like [Panicum miliaceum]|uniref:UDP-glycosyltransferase 91C1-like n=1 Tax=Panicum miliaceum TaxID=4540 RepID=A0A3L6TIW7_PANMI|nr:UDP-glycosyltransferase 91C1-like [Panicum miliaceum]
MDRKGKCKATSNIRVSYSLDYYILKYILHTTSLCLKFFPSSATVSTPGNVARLPPRVELVALPLPRVEGLPDGAESTNAVPYDKLGLLFEAFDGLAAPFAEFLAATCGDGDTRPDWIIVDCYHHWAAARWSTSSSVTNRAAVLPRYESERDKLYHSNLGGTSIAQRYALTRAGGGGGGGVRVLAVIPSCVEWEPEFYPQVAPLLCKPVVPLGLLPPSPDGGRANGEHAAVRWLDAQPPGSVVSVALGSEVRLGLEQVRELALGLELAGARFLWALRNPDADLLPWVPQVSVLAHDAVGGFLTHCEQNSLAEGLLFGRPLIMLPILGDQGPNARLMEGKKVGLQVPRDENDGSFDRHGVASAVRAVMLEEETRGLFVANALKQQEIVADEELHGRYIDQFVEQLRSYTADGNSSTAGLRAWRAKA